MLVVSGSVLSLFGPWIESVIYRGSGLVVPVALIGFASGFVALVLVCMSFGPQRRDVIGEELHRMIDEEERKAQQRERE